MIAPKSKAALSALLALGGVRSQALAADQPCVNVAGAEAGLTHNFCFEGCDAYHTPGQWPHTRVPNLADSPSNPFGDDQVTLLGNETETYCVPEGMRFSGSSKYARLDHALKFPDSAVTVALVVKHDPGSPDTAIEFSQQGRIWIRSGDPDYEEMGVQLVGATSGTPFVTANHIYNGIYYTGEFVTVVATVSGSRFVTYGNGAALPVIDGDPPDNAYDELVRSGPTDQVTGLGKERFRGVIKSVAIWTRALSAAEVAGLSAPSAAALPRWDIEFVGVDSDFSASSADDLVLTYEVSRGRRVEHGVFRKDCSTAIAGTSVNVTETREDKDSEYDTLVLAVDIDKNTLASSNIWNQDASMVELCTVVHLVSEDDALGEMIVAEMKRVTEVDYDLDALYDAQVALDVGAVEKDTESFDATAALSICKCASLDNFTCSDDPLSPDQNDLFLCYTSVDESIEVRTVLSMTISQEGRQSFPAISDGAVRVEAISSTKRQEDGSGYAVWTRVPVAFGDDPGRIAFDFAAGSTLTLSGEVSLQLTGTVYNATGSGTRELQAGTGTAAAGATIEDVASYEIQVELKGGDEQVIEAVSVLSSAASLVTGKVVSIVAVLACLAH